MALEVGRLERHGKPTCSECTPSLQQSRGCRRPGVWMEPSRRGVRFTSPLLCEEPAMTECPVGFLLREAPHIYDVIDAVALVENATPTEFASMPRYAQQAARLFRSEQARLFEFERKVNNQSQARQRATDPQTASGA